MNFRESGFLYLAIGAIIAANVAVVLIFAKPQDALGFSGQLVGAEPWRILTFHFAHFNANHLVENILALIMAGVLASEFGLGWKEFLYSFFFAGFIIAALAGAFLPEVVIAGSSLGVYAVLGALSLKGSKLVPKYVLVPLFAASAFFGYAAALFAGSDLQVALRSSLFHLTGLFVGMALFYVLMRRFRPKRILSQSQSIASQ